MAERKWVLYEKRGKTAIVTINNPEQMNVYGGPTGVIKGMYKAVRDTEEDPEVLTMILTGAGEKAFCAGNNMKRFNATYHAHDAGEGQVMGGGRRYFAEERPRDSIILGHGLQTKPIIAAINGYCLGGGLELACGCDIRIASENATFETSEPRWGMIPGITPAKLTRLIPFNLAMELLLTGRRIDAEEALRIGLVNKVVPLAELIPTCLAIADEINQNAPLAVMAIKEAAWHGLLFYPTVSEAIENNSRLLHEKIYLTEDSKEGVRAFVEKRKPAWKWR